MKNVEKLGKNNKKYQKNIRNVEKLKQNRQKYLKIMENVEKQGKNHQKCKKKHQKYIVTEKKASKILKNS